jgi:PPK2 family polyphosphate:nucleotide phosphotransferase
MERLACAVDSPFLVPFDASFSVARARTRPPPRSPDKDACKKRLAELIEELDALQNVLYAHDNHALLLVFQAMDAAGKDSTIRAVLTGVDPAGCQVFSFKSPSREELDHDFLWRTARCLPERGRIGVFNRSYYEEVLAARVHPEFVQAQRIPALPKRRNDLWEERFASIRDHEAHLARNGTVIVKFWLNVSKAEQRKRFLSRLEKPEKNWKFNAGDVEERAHWTKYQRAYQAALNATSRSWAPWYAVPADDKPFLRMVVAEIVVRTLRGLNLRYPKADPAVRKRVGEIRRALDRT